MWPNPTISTPVYRKDEDPFALLKRINDLLSNPSEEQLGRDLVIRALNDKEKFRNFEDLLKTLVRKAGLYPYLYSEFGSRSADEDFLLRLYRSPYLSGFVFHSLQYKIYRLIMQGRNVVLSAPTSMGKSAIIDSVLATRKLKRVVLVVPTIALIDETRRRIAQQSAFGYEIIHHNSQIPKRNRPTLYILTQERVNERKDLDNIDLFVIDEFYKLGLRGGDDERAIALNIALSKLAIVSKQFYMIGPNIDDIRGLAHLDRPYFFIPSKFNTVAVNVHEYGIASTDRPKKNLAVRGILESNRCEDNRIKQTIIYCRSPQGAGDLAQEIIEWDIVHELSSDYTEWVEENYGKDWIYSRAIRNGVGIHHGSLPRAIQQHTVDLFNQKKISVLVCTSTIIEGVNTNAESVVIYDNRNGNSALDRFTHNNIKGRAGRMRVHFVGEVHCLEPIPEDSLESRVVDVPLGLQDPSSPMTMLTGIQPVHIDKGLSDDFEHYINHSPLSSSILRKHSTFSLSKLMELVGAIEELNDFTLGKICRPGPPSNEVILLWDTALRIVAFRSLQRCNLHFEESDELYRKLRAYVSAETYQSYISNFIAWITENRDDPAEISAAIDRELKIIRNVFGFTVPKVLSLAQDLVTGVCNERGLPFSANFNRFIGIFENSHLPSNLAGLEEMGVPVQTLEKINIDRFRGRDLEVLVRYLRRYVDAMPKLTRVDRMFIARAVGR